MFINQCTTTYLLFMAENLKPHDNLVQIAKNTALYKSCTRSKKSFFLPMSAGITGASIPLTLLWAVLDLTTLSLSFMMGLISVLGVVAVALGVGMAWKNYYKANKEIKNLNSELEIAICNEMIYRELTQRKRQTLLKKSRSFLNKVLKIANDTRKSDELQKILQKYNVSRYELLNSKKMLLILSTHKTFQEDLIKCITHEKASFIRNDKHIDRSQPSIQQKTTNNKAKIFKSLVEGISIVTVLFGSFFALNGYILIGLGFTTTAAILSNPVSIGIALAATTLYGAYFAYKTYEQNKLNSERKAKVAQTLQKVDNLQYQYYTTKKMIHRLDKLETHLEKHDFSERKHAFQFFPKVSNHQQLSATRTQTSFKIR